MYKKSVLLTVIGTIEALFVWLFLSTLLIGQVNWYLAIIFAVLGGMVYGVVSYLRDIRKYRPA